MLVLNLNLKNLLSWAAFDGAGELADGGEDGTDVEDVDADWREAGHTPLHVVSVMIRLVVLPWCALCEHFGNRKVGCEDVLWSSALRKAMEHERQVKSPLVSV